MNTPLELDTFVALVEAGGLSEASRILGEPRATLSRRLSRLEEHFGVKLVHRTTRRFEPTRAGQELYRRGRRIMEDVKAAELALRQGDGQPRGPLRISLPPAGARIAELITSFLEAYPEVEPDILTTARHVDLVAEGIDVALRAGTVEDPTLIRRTLLRQRSGLVASPAYLAARGTPQAVEDLRRHAAIVGYRGGEHAFPAFPLWAGGWVRVHAAVATNDLDLQIQLALAGRGVALLPGMVADPLLAAGRLVAVLPDAIGGEVPASLVYPRRELLEPQVQAFIDHAWAFFQNRPLERLVPDRCPGEGFHAPPA